MAKFTGLLQEKRIRRGSKASEFLNDQKDFLFSESAAEESADFPEKSAVTSFKSAKNDLKSAIRKKTREKPSPTAKT
ncbi:hypothetical protein [Weizmannia acidilactici]|uniref:hypothetical protein n=1 Tax=Weizmannia acidilactici TaxID=2607726 RepID=UPI00124D6747|nr:hypothetical protein [Weizmannia acidilactici]